MDLQGLDAPIQDNDIVETHSNKLVIGPITPLADLAVYGQGGIAVQLIGLVPDVVHRHVLGSSDPLGIKFIRIAYVQKQTFSVLYLFQQYYEQVGRNDDDLTVRPLPHGVIL